MCRQLLPAQSLSDAFDRHTRACSEDPLVNHRSFKTYTAQRHAAQGRPDVTDVFKVVHLHVNSPAQHVHVWRVLQMLVTTAVCLARLCAAAGMRRVRGESLVVVMRLAYSQGLL
jgi:hypothetical protein